MVYGISPIIILSNEEDTEIHFISYSPRKYVGHIKNLVYDNRGTYPIIQREVDFESNSSTHKIIGDV